MTVQWVLQPIPNEREVAWVALVGGERFAAIAEWKRHLWSKVEYLCVFERSPDAPIVFEKLEGAKFFVEKAAVTA